MDSYQPLPSTDDRNTESKQNKLSTPNHLLILPPRPPPTPPVLVQNLHPNNRDYNSFGRNNITPGGPGSSGPPGTSRSGGDQGSGSATGLHPGVRCPNHPNQPVEVNLLAQPSGNCLQVNAASQSRLSWPTNSTPKTNRRRNSPQRGKVQCTGKLSQF